MGSVARHLAVATVAALATSSLAVPAAGVGGTGKARPQARAPQAPELAETSRLPERRSLVVGTRFYEMSDESGLYPAMGFHTRGEMGGFWSQPIKLLDGVWFRVDGRWLGGDVAARRYVSGWGYSRIGYAAADGVQVRRTDVAPDGRRAGLIALTLTSATTRTTQLALDAHSELMKVYPWGETKPSQLTYNLSDTGGYDAGALVFRERGTPPVRNAERHHYTAVVGSRLQPQAHTLGPDHRGPQDPAVVCPASGPDAPPQPARCDDTAYGKGTGGQLRYAVQLHAGVPRTVWFAVAGTDRRRGARQAFDSALAHPERLLAAKVASRLRVENRSSVSLPGNPLLQRSVSWSKQMLASSVQVARHLRLRSTNAGAQYPAPVGRLRKARWIGAGWPDYPWLFGTDGEYTAFASVAAGQFGPIEAHVRALRKISDIVNHRSGKVVHEVTPSGDVYFGANADEGNTDETAKLPSTVALIWRWTGSNAFRDEMYDFAVRNMHQIFRTLDADDDGWPEGLGNVERPGMGEEKLDNAVYTIRGLRDLADMARSKGDTATATWATRRARSMESRFEASWWYGRDGVDNYADSLDDPGNVTVFQRHWIGLTPLDAQLVRPGRPVHPLASDAHAQAVLDKREGPCYSGRYGLFHTGTGPTSAEGGNHGAACDTAVSTVQSERNIFSLNTSIMAVAEGNYGRLGPHRQKRYTDANAEIQLDPQIWEMPGAMPELAPSVDFGSNMTHLFTERSSVLQAWGAYGILWPVVHQQLGVDPDMGRHRVRVVPQLPFGQHHVAGRDIRLGGGSLNVAADATDRSLTTRTSGSVAAALTLGQVLPDTATVDTVSLDGAVAAYRIVPTARGRELRVTAGNAASPHVLSVTLR